MSFWTTIETPAGPFTFVAGDDGAVLSAGWTRDLVPLVERINDTLRPEQPLERADGSAAADAVVAYCDGDLDAPTAIPVRQTGGPFICDAWTALRKVGPGALVTYTQLAERAGRPAAVRAAASACATNPSALFVPCHRVVRRDSGLGGFAWGLDVKRWLLDHEHVATHDARQLRLG